MGKAIESVVGGIKKIDISHQEMDRILQALEDLYTETKANTPDMDWMPVHGVGSLLAHELGYEDMAEFEDAMGDTFHGFIKNFPIVEIKEDERFTGGHVFRIVPDPPREEWLPTKYSLRVRSGKDLWRICHKSRWARVTVPHMEFEISPDGKRHIDTLYNTFGSAITNLTAHTAQFGGGMADGVKQRIMETVAELTQLLDVEEPWDLVMYDPSGVSEITPDADVAVERYDPAQDE